jgi:hypothetical protein
VAVVVYDAAKAWSNPAIGILERLGFTRVSALAGAFGLARGHGYELFEDVNPIPRPLANWSSIIATPLCPRPMWPR